MAQVEEKSMSLKKKFYEMEPFLQKHTTLKKRGECMEEILMFSQYTAQVKWLS